MKRNDPYAPFRPELTVEQQAQIKWSENPTEKYGRIAIEEAKRQLALMENTDRGKNALPDDPEICLRYPGVDPRGLYSAIDVKVKARTMQIETVLNLREESVRELAYGILSHSSVRERWEKVEGIARNHRIFTRAEKLCWDQAAADSLHVQARKLETDPAVAEVDLVLQGLEYLLGIREGAAPDEVQAFYRDALEVTFTTEQYEMGRRVAPRETMNVFFQDFNNQVLQFLFCMPENWGLNSEELDALAEESWSADENKR